MAKYYGTIGFATQVEVAEDIYDEVVVPRKYTGDFLKDWSANMMQNVNPGRITEPRINGIVSVVVDPYFMKHWLDIRYITYKGHKWKVSTVDFPQPTRANVTLEGGIYNE